MTNKTQWKHKAEGVKKITLKAGNNRRHWNGKREKMRNDKNRREERRHSSGTSRAGPNALACLRLMTDRRREKEWKHGTGYTVHPGPWHPMLIERQNLQSNLDIFNTPAHELSLPKVHNKFFHLLRAEWWETDSLLQPDLYSVQALHFIKMLGHFLQKLPESFLECVW